MLQVVRYYFFRFVSAMLKMRETGLQHSYIFLCGELTFKAITFVSTKRVPVTLAAIKCFCDFKMFILYRIAGKSGSRYNDSATSPPKPKLFNDNVTKPIISFR